MLPQRLREATRPWHARAERSGVMGRLLQRRLARADYVRLLRSLLAVYDGLERGLEREAPVLATLGVPACQLRRHEALCADLRVLDGSPSSAAGPAPSAAAYRDRLDQLHGEEAHRLLAHLYVRYLGDLHGGQVLRPLVQGQFALQGAEGTRFYDFGDDDQVLRLRAELRRTLAAARLTERQVDEVVEEAVWAFAAHCELFEQLAEEAVSAQEGPDLPVQRGGALR